jgi:hypothetical protein
MKGITRERAIQRCPTPPNRRGHGPGRRRLFDGVTQRRGCERSAGSRLAQHLCRGHCEQRAPGRRRAASGHRGTARTIRGTVIIRRALRCLSWLSSQFIAQYLQLVLGMNPLPGGTLDGTFRSGIHCRVDAGARPAARVTGPSFRDRPRQFDRSRVRARPIRERPAMRLLKKLTPY